MGEKFTVQLMMAGGMLVGETQLSVAVLPCTAAVLEGTNWKVVPMARSKGKEIFD